MSRIVVSGATTWGTTLAIIIARQGHNITLLARTSMEATELQKNGQHSRFLPGVNFPGNLLLTGSPQQALQKAELVILAVPSRSFRENVLRIRSVVPSSAIMLSASKGLELDTGKRMSEVLREEFPENISERICALSGPNLAGEIINGRPCSTVIASANQPAAVKAQSLIHSSLLRVYTNTDIVGVEYGGALKNILAIAAGICDGMELGDNAKASIVTRGLAEISRLGVEGGAKPATFAGLSGMGDLFATCFSSLSRNHYLGTQIGRGRTLGEAQRSMDNIAEGVDTTAAAMSVSRKWGVSMPITEAINDVLFNAMPVKDVVTRLMDRSPKAE